MTIKKGATRLVIVLRRTVVKIPNFTYSWQNFVTGLCCNMRERDTYRFNPPEKQQMLAPVKWVSWGGWVLIMQRAEILDYDVPYDTWIEAGLGGDDKRSNYGYIGTIIVKVDYGS